MKDTKFGTPSEPGNHGVSGGFTSAKIFPMNLLSSFPDSSFGPLLGPGACAELRVFTSVTASKSDLLNLVAQFMSNACGHPALLIKENKLAQLNILLIVWNII